MEFINQPWFYGFWGALVYAAGRLGSVLFGEKVANDRAVQGAWMRFCTAVVFGPFAAQAFVPTLLDVISYKARPQALSFAVGLSINALWPAIERLAWRSLVAWIGQQLKSIGGAMTNRDGD